MFPYYWEVTWKFPLTQNSRCFIPNLLVESPEVSEMRYKHLLENLASTDYISEGFVFKVSNHSKREVTRISSFWSHFRNLPTQLLFMNHIRHVKCLEKLVKLLKIILTVSHGQASVERGFIANKSLLVENLSMQSLVPQWCVYGYMNSRNLTPENFIAAHYVKASEVQESSMRNTLKSREKQNRATE